MLQFPKRDFWGIFSFIGIVEIGIMASLGWDWLTWNWWPATFVNLLIASRWHQ